MSSIRSAGAMSMICLMSFMLPCQANADEPAFPERWMIRAGTYVVDGANTNFSLNSNAGVIGTAIDYQRDLGGEDRDTIPRIDAYYRFNDRHRIDFTSFSVDRKGQAAISVDLNIKDESFTIGDTVRSDIRYTLYKIGYNYSFYRSPEVELSLAAGLNITGYDLRFESMTGSKSESAGVTVPLPVFGLHMGYRISPRWSVQYVAESFFIEIDNSFRGTLLNYELNTEYRILRNVGIGAGIARLGMDVEVIDPDWKGRVTDSYRGFTLFGAFYF